MLALSFEACPANQTSAKNGTVAPTVMLKGIFEQVAEVQNVSKKQAQDMLVGMVETMEVAAERLKRREGQGSRRRSSSIPGLCLSVREAASRSETAGLSDFDSVTVPICRNR